MATLRSDVIIPEVFESYVNEETTKKDAFLASGVVQPMAQLNASEDGGDFVNVPFWNANLNSTFKVLTDSTSLVPEKITADKQVAAVLHRGDAFEARDLAALAAGSDPLKAVGTKLASYIAHERQKDLLNTLAGVFGDLSALNAGNTAFSDLAVDALAGDTRTALSPGHIAKAKAKLGDQGGKLTSICVHSNVFYDLLERKMVDFVLATDTNASATASGGSISAAYGGEGTVPKYCGLNVIVSDDVTTKGSGASTVYATYLFANGSVGSGQQAGLKTEFDRDILAKSDAMSFDLHYIYHPIGSKWAVTQANPTASQLSTVTNWSKVYETKNIGIVRVSNLSNMD